jgi:hypothetical protein
MYGNKNGRSQHIIVDQNVRSQCVLYTVYVKLESIHTHIHTHTHRAGVVLGNVCSYLHSEKEDEQREMPHPPSVISPYILSMISRLHSHL